jgi:hypothetical protein
MKQDDARLTSMGWLRKGRRKRLSIWSKEERGLLVKREDGLGERLRFAEPAFMLQEEGALT